MPDPSTSARGIGPRDYATIEVRVASLRQLFNSIDPSPFHRRDLDPNAEEFIVESGRELPSDARLALRVHLDRTAGEADDAQVLRDSVHEYFGQRAVVTRRRLRELLRRGRTSLAIGLAFLVVSVALGDVIGSSFEGSRLEEVIREGLLIGGWVAMWRPIQIFLYDWWPLRAEARLFDRLAAMPVEIACQDSQSRLAAN